MKKYNLSCVLMAIFSLGLITSLYAQAKVETEKLIDQYDRNSVTIIYVSHGGAYENELNTAIQGWFGDKFDRNDIATRSLTVNVGEGEKIEEKLDARINELNIGKEIVAQWLDRKSDGTMNTDKISARGSYNAKDEDVIKDAASKVSHINESGQKLIENSYLVVVDGKVEKKTAMEGNGIRTTGFVSYLTSYVYRIDFNEDMLNTIYETMWIDSEDDAATKAAKNKAWNDFAVTMTRVASANVMGIDNGSRDFITGEETAPDPVKAVNNAYDEILRKLETKISDWQVKCPIYSVRPITAKIGKKEGLKNGSRLKVMKYEEDEEGKLTMKKNGFVRATTIADNDTLATGKSKTSTFYQISGVNAKEGMMLFQSNDLKIGVSVEGELGGLSFVNGSVDYLVHINNMGLCQYAMVDFGFDIVKLSYQESGTTYVIDEKYSFFNFGLGYAFGVPLTRLFEIRPSMSVCFDYLNHDSTGESDSETGNYGAIYAKPSVRFSWQVAYPVRIYAQADYSLSFFKGEVYKFFDQESTILGMGKRGGLGLSVGVRVAF